MEKEQINVEHERKTLLFRLQSGGSAIINETHPTHSRQNRIGLVGSTNGAGET